MKIAIATAAAAIALAASPTAASTCVGNCGTATANGSIIAPPSGATTFQYVSTAGGVTGAGQIAGVGGTNGSAFISDAFNAVAGDVLSFNFNYITTDGSGYADYGFAELLNAAGANVAYLFTARTTPSGNTSPGFGLPANSATLNPGSTPIQAGTTFDKLGTGTGGSGACYSSGCGNTGWIGSTYSIANAGVYTIRFGVTNFSDTGYQSALAFNGLAINNVGIGAVPEPATWAMMLVGFGMVAGAARYRRRSTVATFA